MGGLERTRRSRDWMTYYLADGLMRIVASVYKERNIGAEEYAVIRITPDFRIYRFPEIKKYIFL